MPSRPPIHRRDRPVQAEVHASVGAGETARSFAIRVDREVFGTRTSRDVEILAALIDPAKLDTLKGDRAANGRRRKICYWLKDAEKSGSALETTIDVAQQQAGYGGMPRAPEDKKALLRNLTILDRLGCLTDDGLEKLRVGNAPTITRGPYAGDVAEVDHIIPRPEDCPGRGGTTLNFMPKTMNRKKCNGIGQRQKALAKRWAGEACPIGSAVQFLA